MGGVIVIPKRKMLRPQADTTQPEPINSAQVSPVALASAGETPSTLDFAIVFVIDGGGSVITTGQKGHIRVPCNATILNASLMADQAGSIVIDIWKDTLLNFPPTDADSITASAPPTLSTEQISLDTTLTGWTTDLATGDILAYNVDSVATVTRVTITLTCRRT